MNHRLPSGATRLVSRPSRADVRLPPAEYPSNARCFVHLNARLLPYWHSLFDICPGLLKLDPPEGLNLFRSFMTWAYRNRPPLNWMYYLGVCRWLLGSPWRTQIDEEPIEALMAAAAARWASSDDSPARGMVLAWQGAPINIFDWKDAPCSAAERQDLPAPPWDFAWCPLDPVDGFSRWLPVP